MSTELERKKIAISNLPNDFNHDIYEKETGITAINKWDAVRPFGYPEKYSWNYRHSYIKWLEKELSKLRKIVNEN